MASVPEFISVLRRIRDIIYPEINELYSNSLELKDSIDVGKAEFDADLLQFNTDYSDFNTKKDEVDASVISANNSALSASASATIATNKSNEIKAITAQSTTGAPGTSASAGYNPTDGKFTFVIPQGSKGDKGESFTVNSSGATAQRALYDAQPAGWSFLDITTSTLYFKASNTSGDWSSGVPFGKGDKGDTGDTGVGITSFTFVSTTDVSGLPAKSGATDTYRVTLTNATTFDYNIYNGLDYSQELLDDKLDKDFSAFTDKTTPADTDIIAIREAGGTTKKLSWLNIKNTLKTYFDTLYLSISASNSKLGTDNLLMIQDQKASGTNGDTLTLNAWKKTTKNTVIINNIIGASISASVITLPSGTYYVESIEPVGVGVPTVQASFKSRLYNVTDAVNILIGTSSMHKSDSLTNEVRYGEVSINGIFTIASSKNVEIDIYNTGILGANGYTMSLGGVIEVYGTLKIWKVA